MQELNIMLNSNFNHGELAIVARWQEHTSALKKAAADKSDE
ncbi:hypothetical protein [Buttiauxella warmboldiae]|nr:hypothetical protein [Buttiauxella warmboldiae]